jgi:hypothetical protein
LSGRYSRQSPGYFIVRTNRKYPKFTVFHKKVTTGIFYNGTIVEKIASFQISEEQPGMRAEMNFIDPMVWTLSPEVFLSEKKKNWAEIHANITATTV